MTWRKNLLPHNSFPFPHSIISSLTTKFNSHSAVCVRERKHTHIHKSYNKAMSLSSSSSLYLKNLLLFVAVFVAAAVVVFVFPKNSGLPYFNNHLQEFLRSRFPTINATYSNQSAQSFAKDGFKQKPVSSFSFVWFILHFSLWIEYTYFTSLTESVSCIFIIVLFVLLKCINSIVILYN